MAGHLSAWIAALAANCLQHPVQAAFAGGGAAAGFRAAWLWWRASKMPLVASFVLDGRHESGDPETQRLDELAGFSRCVTEAGRLNAKAAALTAMSVALGVIAELAGLGP